MLLYFLLYCLAIQMVHGRYAMYLTGQHPIVPEQSLVSNITHVALAFMRSDTFNAPSPPSTWPFFTSVEEVRTQFAPGTAVMIAIGGWGDTKGFEIAAATDESRQLFARNIAKMVDDMGADGVDIDWEYPGGNGEDYKQIPNESRAWEIIAYPSLLSAIRAALGPDKLLSAAVPGLRRDMLAFTSDTIPLINKSIDFLNIMTYDLMNRRDNITKHHTGVQLSLDAVNAYIENGLPPEKANLGFAFYVKGFRTDPNGGGCETQPVGCKTTLMEDPVTGADLGQTVGFAWCDEIPPELRASFRRAEEYGTYDDVGGGHYYWDSEENLWWTWDTADAILKKFPAVMEEKRLGGVFAWGLGEDSKGWGHLKALTAGYQKYVKEKLVMDKPEWYKEEL